jgi:hypothetical protein
MTTSTVPHATKFGGPTISFPIDPRTTDRAITEGFSDQGQEIQFMLRWYRSRDLEKVTLATHWLVSADIQDQLKGLIDDLRSGDFEQVRDAKHILAAFSELGVKTMVALLDDPEIHYVVGEILAKMDDHVLPHLIRWIGHAESFNVRTGIYRGLTGHLHDFRARKVLSDGLRSSDPLEAAFVCQALLDAGAQGQKIIEIVSPQTQLLVA